MAKGTPGRKSNWEGFCVHVGASVYDDMKRTKRATAMSQPTYEALLRLGKAALHALAVAEKLDSANKAAVLRRVARGKPSATPRV